MLLPHLEIYVKGSLNLFNHRTNVNVNNRIVCLRHQSNWASR